MAITCSICQKKQSGWYENYPLSNDYSAMRICVTCQEYKNSLENSTKLEDWKDAIEYFKNIFLSVDTCEEAKTIISEIIKTREPAIEIEDIKQAEIQRLEKEKQEEAERNRIAEEEKLREEREKKYSIRLEQLRARGADGYYEYKAVSLMDTAGLFRTDSGRVDTNAMTIVLNELGLDGWHLVTAYSNELGKNALSGGVGGAVLGINSTVDENILIFERFVKIP